MNKRYFTAGLIPLFFATAFGQEQNSMGKLTTQCETIIEYTSQIAQLRTNISEAKSRLQQLREDWKTTCLEYINSENQTADDILYLINNTYPEIDGEELKNRLIEASKNIDNPKPGTKRPVEETSPATETTPEEPREENKQPTEKEKEREEPPVTSPRGKDINQEIKTIINDKNKQQEQ